MAKQQILHCSFCGRNRDEVKILIAGQDGHICESCVEHAEEIIEQEDGYFEYIFRIRDGEHDLPKSLLLRKIKNKFGFIGSMG